MSKLILLEYNLISMMQTGRYPNLSHPSSIISHKVFTATEIILTTTQRSIRLRESLTLRLGLTRAMAAVLARELPMGVDNSIAALFRLLGGRRLAAAVEAAIPRSPVPIHS
jgi:hypothetical protein